MIRLHSCQLGQKCYIEEDYEREHLNIIQMRLDWGIFEAHYNLSYIYHKGEGVEKDLKKEM